ncbi:MAG TPA: helix-turn-helix transcriptional regulator [Planctomycetota bacterium]|nr:helix-turn-helix transcriptional regulator [Planctomycetota bacterium]
MPRKPSLRELRMRLKVRPMTQSELARAVGVHPSTVNLLEGGHKGAGPDVVRKLARALRVDVATLRQAIQESKRRAELA